MHICMCIGGEAFPDIENTRRTGLVIVVAWGGGGEEKEARVEWGVWLNDGN